MMVLLHAVCGKLSVLCISGVQLLQNFSRYVTVFAVATLVLCCCQLIKKVLGWRRSKSVSLECLCAYFYDMEKIIVLLPS